ncbi:hypothetical protein [Chitinophaga sp. SYP-B3965]|uniref:hypothetical protein n=1 Tax=Chitinophaga sp. SYP-B3965 TaxID=2663120 RepID=UPI001562F357|nr:hypothetical protein [Chitinophaga sp. SYP-B3965]
MVPTKKHSPKKTHPKKRKTLRPFLRGMIPAKNIIIIPIFIPQYPYMKIKPLQNNDPWYDKTGLVVFLLIGMPIIGIYGLARSSTISKGGKIGLVIFTLIVWSLIGAGARIAQYP